jgi:diguanylate cyclase (GGDEF)-like protein
LHDIGKIGIPDAILQKPGRLDDAEQTVMRGHPALGASILAEARSDELSALVPLIRHHHEWEDGSGYPEGLRADEIPDGAAIIAVADAFDTMVTDRPYRRARPFDEAFDELYRAAGTQFRAEIVSALEKVVTDSHQMPPRIPARSDGGMTPEEREAVAGARQRFGGAMGDLRALNVLVDLANMTGDLADLPTFLRDVAGMVRRRFNYQHLMLLLLDPPTGELVVAAHSSNGGSNYEGHRLPRGAGITGVVMLHGEAQNVPDVTQSGVFSSEWPNKTGSELIVPLIADGRSIGVIDVESTKIAAFTSADEVLLTAIAGQVAAAINVAQLHDEAKRAAVTDGLTGVLNHRAFYDQLEELLIRHTRLAVVLFDVEGLKCVNDSAGHLAGDALLRRVAATIRAQVRADDMVARYGGDEFGVLMPGVSARAALARAESVREVLRSFRGDTLGLGLSPATVRFGVAEAPADGVTPVELVAAADARLYEMRNRFSMQRAADEIDARGE